MPLISIIIPTYNEEENLAILAQRLQELPSHIGYDYEFIFVDDGSTDNSFSILKNLSNKNSRIRIIRFSRNFGK